MPVRHLSADASPDQVAAVLAEDACVVIDRLASAEQVDRLCGEMSPFLEATAIGPDEFTGKCTRRTGGLIARSPASHEFVMHPSIVATAKQVLSHATTIQLHLTQIIAIGPGETGQPIHRDQWAFDFFPFPSGYEVQCNTLWALTDFSEENGATRVVPGSHRSADKLEVAYDDTEPAEMERGSVLLYTGALYHGGGANRSEAVRIGLNITYNVSWLRQEENQYLSVPLEQARELPDELLKMMGYARGAYALGYVDDLRDPLDVLRGKDTHAGFGDLDAVAQKVRGTA